MGGEALSGGCKKSEVAKVDCQPKERAFTNLITFYLARACDCLTRGQPTSAEVGPKGLRPSNLHRNIAHSLANSVVHYSICFISS